MRRRRDTPAQIKRTKARYEALKQPISSEDARYQAQFLEAVQFGKGVCWIYARRSTGGASNAYARFKFHGVWVMAHRFALALKLGCTLWDLEGYDAAHAPADLCLGGRCCNPDHLTPKRGDPHRSWDKAKDIAMFGMKPSRSKAEQRKMMAAFYPNGLKISGSLPDFITVI